MVCNHVDLKQLRFSGFRVSGSSLSDNSALMTFNHCRNITISNNIFAGIGNKEILSFHSSNNGYPLRETSTSSNILIINNKVLDCYGGFVGSSAWNTCIKNNDCENLASFYEFGSVISVAARNYEVSNNKICNYGSYTGISVGDSRLANHTVSGVIEYNQIYFTPDFIKDYERNTVMDGGGIYLITHQDSTICRYNIIHDIKGRRSYRGVFCDDGAYDFQLIGNLVSHIDGPAIESRYVPWNLKSNSVGYANNVNNIMKYNIHYIDNNVILADTAVKVMQKVHQLSSGTVIAENEQYLIIDTFKADFVKKYFAGQKIAIFYKFKSEFEMLKACFDNWTSDAFEFQNDPLKVFLGQFISSREGIRLDAAKSIVFFNIDFSYLSYEQARNRIASFERETPAKLYWLFSDKGIEKRIYKAVKNKMDYTLRIYQNERNDIRAGVEQASS